ncbi:MAG: hypothetical protein ACREUK_05605, partial [Burkholderiales bacterium]
LLAEVANQEIAQALVVVHDEDSCFKLGHGLKVAAPLAAKATRRYPPAAQKHIVTKIRAAGIPAAAQFRTIVSVMTFSRRAILVLALAAAIGAPGGSALAQGRGWRERPLTPQERERLREQVDSARRDVYRRQREEHPHPRQLTPEQREQLRRDIQDANRDLERHRQR